MASMRDPEVLPWHKLRTEHAAEALEQLFHNRHKLGSISAEQAEAVQAALGRLQGDGNIQAWRAGMALLARWAAQISMQPQPQGEHNNSRALLLHTVTAVLQQVQQPSEAWSLATAAALPFLGSAIAGCPPDLQHACLSAGMAVVQHLGPANLGTEAFADVLQGLQQLLVFSAKENRGTACSWLLASLVVGLEQVLPLRLTDTPPQVDRQHSHAAASTSAGEPAGAAAHTRSCHAAASTLAGEPAGAAAHTRGWLAAQRVRAQEVELASRLSRLYQLGASLGRAAAQGAPAVPQQQREGALAAAARLLLSAAHHGSLVSSALCGSIAAGVLDGALGAMQPAAAAAATGAPGAMQLPAQLQPLWDAVDIACSRSAAAAGYGSAEVDVADSITVGGGAAVTSLCCGLVGLGCARLHTARSPWLAAQQPSLAGLLCAAHALTHHAVSLSGVYHHAAADTLTASTVNTAAPSMSAMTVLTTAKAPPTAPSRAAASAPAATAIATAGTAAGAPSPLPAVSPRAAAANAWLAAQAASAAPQQEASNLARHLAQHGAKLNMAGAAALAGAMRGGAAVLACGYADYALLVEPAVAAQLDTAAVRGVLDRAFLSQVVVLSALWQGAVRSPARQVDQQLGQRQAFAALQAAAGSAAQQDRQAGQTTAPVAAGASALSQQAEAQHSGPGDQQMQRGILAAEALGALSLLQFCRPQGLQQYEELLAALVAEVAASGDAAQALLQRSLPCYAGLVLLVEARQARGTLQQQQQQQQQRQKQQAGFQTALPRWEADSVLAARLGFLLPLLPLAWRAAPDAASAAAVAMPLLLLLVQHPLPALSLAAHAAYGSIASGCSERAGCSEAVLERSLPLYLRRSLEAYPCRASLGGLQLGLHYALQALPQGSVAALLCVRRVALRVLELLGCADNGSTVVAGAAGGTVAAGLAAGVSQAAQVTSGEASDAAAKLFALLPQLLLAVDYSLLPSAVAPVSAIVQAAPPQARSDMLATLHAVLLRSEDYTRKGHLMRWLYEELQAAGGAAEKAAGGGRRRLGLLPVPQPAQRGDFEVQAATP